VRRVTVLASSAAGQARIIRSGQTIFRYLRACRRRKRCLPFRGVARVGAGEIAIDAARTTSLRRGQLLVREFLLRRAQQEVVLGAQVQSRELLGLVEIRSGDGVLVGIQLDDALAQ